MRVLLLATIVACITPAQAFSPVPTYDQLLAENEALKAKLATCESSNVKPSTDTACRPLTASFKGSVPEDVDAIGAMLALQNAEPYLLQCIGTGFEHITLTMNVNGGVVIPTGELYSPSIEGSGSYVPVCIRRTLNEAGFPSSRRPYVLTMYYNRPSHGCTQ